MTPTRTQRLAALFAALLALAGTGAARAASSAWQENPQSRVRLITPYQTAPRQGELRLGLHYKLFPGWHVYWKNSGDAGFAPVVTFEKTAGIQRAELLWPAPHRFELPGNLVAFGYEDEVVYPVRATVQAAGDRLEITATLDYLVCEVDCVPYRYDLRLTQPLGDAAAPDPETAPLIERAWASLPVPAGQLAGVSTRGVIEPGPEGSAMLEVRVAGAEPAPAPDGPQLFLESHPTFEADKPRYRQVGGDLLFRVPLRPREVGQTLPARTPFAWTVTGLRHAGRPASLEARQEVPRQDLEGAPPAAPQAAPARRLPSMLLLAFWGGLLLNLTPSVLALLMPAWLELRAAPSRSAPVAVAAGILALAWGTALLTDAARRAGWQTGWGSQLQEPAAAALLAVVAAGVALNLWGLAGAPLAPAGKATVGTGRWLLAGLLTPLLAYAWILPVLTDPVGFAGGSGLAASLAVFTAVGLGLAAPYLALAARPGRAERAAGPPPWLDRLREALGFAAAAGTFWLLYALARQVSPEGLAWIELALLAMALFAWLRHQTVRQTTLKFVLTVGLLVCAALTLWLADRNRLTPRPDGTPAPAALQAAGEP